MNRKEIRGQRTLTKGALVFLGVGLLIIFQGGLLYADEDIAKERFRGDEEAPWQITADKISYDEREGLVQAEGDVVIRKGEQRLSAQKAKYMEKLGIVEVSGDMRFEINGDIITGEQGRFDLNNNTGRITKGRLFLQQNHFYLSSDSMEKIGLNTYVLKDFRLTSCDGEPSDWSIHGKEAEVTIEGYGKVRDATVKIRDIPVFYLPYGLFPAKTKRQTGLLLPRFGYSSLNGFEAEVPVYWAISDQTDATFYARYLDERGFMPGIEFRYAAKKASRGTFLFDMLSDGIDEKELTDPEQIAITPLARTNQTRYWFRSKTNQGLPWGIDARLDTDYVSDQDFLREFTGGLYGYQARSDLEEAYGRVVEDIRSPTRRSALRLSRDREDYSLQFQSEYNEVPENPPVDDTPQPLANLDFSVLPKPLLRLPLFFKLNTDYQYIWRDVGPKGQSVSLSPKLNYPIWFSRYLEFEPSIAYGVNIQWLDDSFEGVDHQTKDVYQLGGRLSTVVERIFGFQWRDTKRLKHRMRPAFTYEYRIPEKEEKPSPWFQPVEAEGKINRIALSFENLLDARQEDQGGGISYQQWGLFNLIQGYDIDEARRDREPWRSKKPFEPLRGILTLTPFSDLNFKADARWDHYEDAITFADIFMDFRVKLLGDRKDVFSVDYQYEKNGAKSLRFAMDFHLTHGFSVGTSLTRDLDLGNTIDNRFWVDFQSQCWGVRLAAEKLDEIDTFSINIRLLGLGGIASNAI